VFSYATPSLFESDLSQARLGFCCDAGRPLEFEARVVAHIPLLRFGLRALGELIWSSDDDGFVTLDPIVTAHPDGLIFEAFSSDLSCYGRLAISPEVYQIEGAPVWGTTNVDFSGWLWAALGELRSSRETWLRLSPGGVELKTLGAGGRFEPKVEVPLAWYRAFLELQAAINRPGTELQVAPVDLLAPIRFLRYSKARLSPRGLRYECSQGRWSVILEPWEKVFDLRISGSQERRIRTWGRQRLRLLEPLLPFARQVTIKLCGRAMPHFYRLQLPGMSFWLGLTGSGRQAFDSDSGYSLWRGLSPAVDEAALQSRLQELSQALVLPEHPLDVELVRRGLAMGEPDTRRTRYRPLQKADLDLAAIYPPDPRQERARELAVEVLACEVQEQRKLKRLPGPHGQGERELIFRDWKVRGRVQDLELEMVVSEREQILFGRCGCDFFQSHLLQKGPCEHLLALFEASREQRLELPTSVEVQGLPHDE